MTLADLDERMSVDELTLRMALDEKQAAEIKQNT